jgi:hypothetical protein
MTKAQLQAEHDVMKTIYDRVFDLVRKGDESSDMLKAGVLNACRARGRIRSGSSTTCRKGCGHTTTSCLQMWSKRIVLAVIALAVPATVLAQAPLADAIQKGDRKAALALIASGADVNKRRLTARRRCTGRPTRSIASWSWR